jgi:hypothetical protein
VGHRIAALGVASFSAVEPRLHVFAIGFVLISVVSHYVLGECVLTTGLLMGFSKSAVAVIDSVPSQRR